MTTNRADKKITNGRVQITNDRVTIGQTKIEIRVNNI